MAIYDGVSGVVAAWARFKYWIGVELPDQWDQLNAILGGLGAAVASGGTSTEITPVESPIVAASGYAIPPGYTLGDYFGYLRTAVEDQAEIWRTAWAASHTPIMVGLNRWGIGGPTIVASAMAFLQWEALLSTSGEVFIAPIGVLHPANAFEYLWHPGLPWPL